MTAQCSRTRASLLAGSMLVALVAFATPAQAAVSGRVLGPDGKPVAGVTVTAHARESAQEQGERHAAGRPRTAVASLRSGADGTFRIEAGRPFVWLEARAEGFAPAAVTATDDTPITFALRKTESRRGVIRAYGKPVAGAVVVWTSGNAEQIARTAADGIYEVPDPETSPARVQVIHPDFAPLESPVAGKGSTLDHELTKGAAVTGSVVDVAGRPVAGAVIYVDGDLPASKTDARGDFSIPHAQEEWSYLTARTERLVGAAGRRGGAIVITAKPPRSVSGVVREDKTGLPLAGATVVAATAQGLSVSADSDARGQYVLQGVPPGRYRIYAGRDGFQSGPADYLTAEPLDLREAITGRRDFTLARLPQITGRVEDEERQPVDGALVALGFKDTPALYAADASFGMEGASTRTNADGSFRLQAPTAGEEAIGFLKDWSVTVLKAGYAAAQADHKSLAPGTPVTIRLTRGVELKGRVTASDGTPLPGVAVSAAEDGAFGGMLLPMHVILASIGGDGWTKTDAAGRFEMRVRPVVHHLSFRKPGHAPKVVRGHDPRSAAPLEVALDPAALLRGRVARADGSGIAGVTVAATQEMRWQASSAVTGPDGAFELADLAPGQYQLTASDQDLGIHLSRTVEAPGDVQMVLGPAATLRGRVTDAATGLPVTRFKIAVTPDEASERQAREVPAEDAGGAFSIADVPVGEVGVVATAAGYAARRADVTVTADAEAPELELALAPEAPIAGRITSEAKAPVPEARVTVEAADAEEKAAATTDDDGAYELRGVPAGSVTIAVQAEGYLPEKRTFDTRESARADVTLRKGLALRGEVVYQGAGVAQAFVTASSSTQGATSQNAQTDERGRFTLEGLVAGRYTVSGFAEGKGKAKMEDVDVERAGSLRLVLERGATAVLTGTVVGLPAGEEAGFVSVTVMGEQGESAQGMVDAAHAFRIEDAPAGRVQARAAATFMSGTGRSSRAVDLTLAAGSETEILLRFAGDVAITGLVVRDGAPVPGVTVGFSAPDGTGSTGRTDTRGAYEVAGLDPGGYQVTVHGDNTYFATSHLVAASGEFDMDITGGSVSGRAVRADDGTPVGNVAISFFRENETTSASSAATNGQGIFWARSLHEGPYRLITSKAGFGQVVRTVDVPRGGTAEVVLELSEADGISVTVIDARNGRPLDAIVVVRDMARQIVANQHSGVGPDGVLNIPLAPGSYLLSTSAGGYGTVTRPVTAPAQGLSVGLTPGGTLVIESPRDLRGRVRLIQPDGEEYVRCWCNGIAEIQLKGRWTSIENITPNSYTVEMLDAAEGGATRPVLIREGQTSSVTFE
jgi:uncharacterized GH25 family protein